MLSALGQWAARNPIVVGLLLTISATLVYFFGFYHPFVNGELTTARWAWEAWNPEGNQEHGRLVPLIAIGLIYWHWESLLKAPKKGSNWGLLPLLGGILLFLAAVRCLQPRLAIAAIPFLLYGSVLFVCGKASARIVFFPSIFLFFMVPVAALEQATFRLQFIVTEAVGFLSNILGIGIAAMGTTLTATDGAFNFEIAEGCSGIRSLAAMTMLTAAYVYITQDRLWKQVVIFLCSVGFAIVGNIGRIFTVVLCAKYYDPEFASGLYHDYSGYVFFPIAIMAMLAFSKFVNLPIFNGKKAATKKEVPA